VSRHHFVLSLYALLLLVTTFSVASVSATRTVADDPFPPLAAAAAPPDDDTIVSITLPPFDPTLSEPSHDTQAAAARIVQAEPARIIGNDDRELITDTRFLPHSAIVQIIGYDANNLGWLCTGFFYAPHVVATAGHCIYNKNPQKGTIGWWQRVTVTPGLNGSAKPFPTCVARSLYSVPNWTVDGNPNSDYGAIRLDCGVGHRTGVLPIEEARTQDVGDYQPKYMVGYSGDKKGITQWFRSGVITGWNVFRIKYDIDMVGGDSGAPVYRMGGDCPSTCVMAINSWEYYYDDNYGVRFRARMLKFFWDLTRHTYIPII
jgi:V8-like Glu-specific endopeptidase